MSTPQVRKRHVLYVAGFDPRGPGHTHRLYTDEARKQAALAGYQIEVGPRMASGAHGAAWSVRLTQGGAVTDTNFECLRWDDIVRAHWPRGSWGVWAATARASAWLLGSGALWRALKLSWPAGLALALPTLALLGLMVVALSALLLPGPAWLWLALGGTTLAGMAWRLRVGSFLPWLMRSVGLQARLGAGELPQLNARLDALAARVQAAMDAAGPDEEVLLVGHSAGAALAMSVAARALRGRPQGRLALLTLGHATQLLSQQPKAAWFRADLLTLATHPHLSWVDASAPPDACCFALVPPTAHASAELAAAAAPTLLNPRFAQLFEARTYAQLRRDKYRCHFQYVMAGQRPGAWDYFLTTAGPLPLGQRHPAVATPQPFRRLQRLGRPSPW